MHSPQSGESGVELPLVGWFGVELGARGMAQSPDLVETSRRYNYRWHYVLWGGLGPKPGSYLVSRSAVTSLSPVKDHPVWQATDTQPWRGPTGMLQSRRHYLLTATDLDDACPGSLLYSVKRAPKTKDNFLGELWIRYDLTFIGPRQAPA